MSNATTHPICITNNPAGQLIFLLPKPGVEYEIRYTIRLSAITNSPLQTTPPYATTRRNAITNDNGAGSGADPFSDLTDLNILEQHTSYSHCPTQELEFDAYIFNARLSSIVPLKHVVMDFTKCNPSAYSHFGVYSIYTIMAVASIQELATVEHVVHHGSVPAFVNPSSTISDIPIIFDGGKSVVWCYWNTSGAPVAMPVDDDSVAISGSWNTDSTSVFPFSTVTQLPLDGSPGWNYQYNNGCFALALYKVDGANLQGFIRAYVKLEISTGTYAFADNLSVVAIPADTYNSTFGTWYSSASKPCVQRIIEMFSGGVIYQGFYPPFNNFSSPIDHFSMAAGFFVPPGRFSGDMVVSIYFRFAGQFTTAAYIRKIGLQQVLPTFILPPLMAVHTHSCRRACEEDDFEIVK